MEITHSRFHFIVNCSHTPICNHICKKPKSFPASWSCPALLQSLLFWIWIPATWAADPRKMIHQSGNSPFCETEGCWQNWRGFRNQQLAWEDTGFSFFWRNQDLAIFIARLITASQIKPHYSEKHHLETGSLVLADLPMARLTQQRQISSCLWS